MKKKWIAVITAAAVLLSAAAGLVTAGELLSLRRAVQSTLAQNPRARLAELGGKKANLELSRAHSLADYYGRLLNTLEPLPNEEAMYRFLYIDIVKAQSDKEIAAKQAEVTRNQLAFEAQENYLRLVKALEQKKLLEQTVERAKDLKRLTEAAHKAGTAARSEIMRAEAHVINMEAALFGAESAIKMAEAALNMTLGQPLDAAVSLEETLSIPAAGEINLEHGTNRALADNIDIMKARAGVRLAEAALLYARNRLGASDESFEIAEIGLQEAKIFLQLAEERVRLEVYGVYQKLAGMEKQLAARQKGLELAAENYRLSKLRYELGVATQGEVIDTMLALREQESKLAGEKYDYYLDYLNWRLKTALPVN